MPSPFDALDASSQAVVDLVFGEGIRVRPQHGDGSYTGGADPSRPVRENVRATVARAASIKPTDFNNSNRNGVPVAMTQPEIWIDRLAYAALGYRIVRNDIVELTDDGEPAPRFTVSAVNDGDNGDVQLILAG